VANFEDNDDGISRPVVKRVRAEEEVESSINCIVDGDIKGSKIRPKPKAKIRIRLKLKIKKRE